MLNSVERHVKAVLQRYPLDLPIEAVLDHPHVVSTEQRRAIRGKAPTRQLLELFVGAVLDRLNLGPRGRYPLRHYDKGSLRCYRCQRYRHLQGLCTHPVKCGVCSQSDVTEDCIRRQKESKVTTARCSNCAGPGRTSSCCTDFDWATAR